MAVTQSPIYEVVAHHVADTEIHAASTAGHTVSKTETDRQNKLLAGLTDEQKARIAARRSNHETVNLFLARKW